MNLIRNSWYIWLQFLLLAGYGVLCCLPAVGHAQVAPPINWIGAPGPPQDWGVAANWNPLGPPASGDSAIFYQFDNEHRIANYNILSPAPNLASVIIDAGANGSMTLLLAQPGVELRADVVNVGEKIHGALEQSAGNLTVHNHLYLGYSGGSTGTYTMSGGALGAANSYVGNGGTGIFNQSGGSHNVINNLQVGSQVGSNGYYAMSEGVLPTSLNTTNTLVGNLGAGTFDQSGGTHTVSNELQVGSQAGSAGTYNLQGGILSSYNTIVGDFGTGIFNQTGGTHTVTNYLILGRETGSSGAYSLENNGLLNAMNTCVGYSGTGAFQQIGPSSTHAVGTALVLGALTGSNGNYSLENGSLSSTYTIVGYDGAAAFQQTGASTNHAVGDTLILGLGTGSGTYNLGNGALSSATTHVGYAGSGYFNQNGGSHNVSTDLHVGFQALSYGNYSMTGGVLNTANSLVGDAGSGNFYQDGGIHNVTNDLQVGSQALSYGYYTMSEGVLLTSLNTANTLVGNLGAGYFYQNGGTHTVTNDLQVGSQAGSYGYYALTGGLLKTANSLVGNAGMGDFYQNGGIHNVSTNLILGQAAGSVGTYTLNSGTLAAVNALVGVNGAGYFYQNGGTHNLSGDLTLANPLSATGQGAYNLTGGDFTVVNINLNGGGIFNQTGGTLNADIINLNLGSALNLTAGGLNAGTINLLEGLFFQDYQNGASLNYAIFNHQGGEVHGGLENRGTYNYSSGLFSGRLYNYGVANFFNVTNDFIAGDGMSHLNPSTPVTLGAGQSLTFNGRGLEVDQGAVFTQDGGSLTTSQTIIGNFGTGIFNQNGGSHNTLANPTTLILGANAGSTGHYNLANGDLYTINTFVGNFGTGIFNQTGGSHTVANALSIGNEAGSTGYYYLVNGALSSMDTYVGNYGRGTFEQTGLNTTHTVSNALVLGFGAGSNGAYLLENGSLSSTYYTIVGYDGSGVFRQTGVSTTHAVGDALFLGLGTGSGTYYLENGALSSGVTYVGYTGSGAFEQSGGSHDVTNELKVGYLGGSYGTYTLDNGSVTPGFLFVGYNGTGYFYQNGGEVAIANHLWVGREAGSLGEYNLINGTFTTQDLYVGYAGTGTFNKNGGDITVNGFISMAELYTGNATFNLASGSLAATHLDVGLGGIGVFTQSSGTTLTIGSSLTPGILGVNSQAGTSTFIQYGGNTTVFGDVQVGYQPGSRGEYFLNGGSLTAANLDVGLAGVGTFCQSSGTTLTIGSALTPGILGVNSQAGTSTFIQYGGNTTVFGNIEVGREIGSRGEYFLNGGTLDTLGSLYLGYGGTGIFNKNVGDITVNGFISMAELDTGNATFNLANGTLSTTNLDVGQAGIGAFNQSSGTTLTIGSALTPGILGVNSQAGTSTFIQYGGNTTVFGNIEVGYQPGSRGEYFLNGGSLTAANLDVGTAGTGYFYQSGGTSSATFNNDLKVVNGIYALSGGTLDAPNVFVGDGSSARFNLTGGTLNAVTINLNPGGTFYQEGGNLNYTTFLHQGGTVQNSLVNQSAYIYDSGVFNGRLYNNGTGTVTFNADFIATNGLAHRSTNPITQAPGRSFTFNGEGLEVDQGTVGAVFTLDGGLLAPTDTRLNTSNTIIGKTGTGTFNQNGGSHTISNTLTLAETAGSTGTYNLAGGTLTAGNIYVNAGGTLNQTVGTLLTSRNTFTVGAGGAFSATDAIVDGSSNTIFLNEGTCTLTNSTFRPGNTMRIGPGGSFSQTGGIVDGSSNTIFLNEGTCSLTNSTFTPGNTTFVNEGTCNLTNSRFTPGNTMRIGPGGSFSQTGGIVDGSSNTILIIEGSRSTYDLNNGTVRSGSMIVQNGGTFNQSGDLADGSSNTIAISEGTCNVSGGTYNAGTLNIYTGGRFNWTGGAFSYNTLNLQGGNFTGNLDNWGLISGFGGITGNVTNHGMVSPGNSPGVLNIAGSFTQTATGTYTVEIASPNNYDKINVSGAPGTASVNGTLKPVLLGGYIPTWNQRFPGIITATGGVSGAFSTIDSSFSWKLRYNPTSIDLIAGNYNFAKATFPLTANQRNVGLMFNQVADTASGDLGTVLSDLSLLPAGAVGNAYQQISPDKAGALPVLSLAGSMMQWQGVANRLSYQRWRRGGLPNLAGGRSGSMKMSYNSLAGMMLAYNGADLTGLTSAPRPQPESAGTWGLFTDFVSSFGTQDSTANVTGYKFTIFGFTTGADYRLRDDLVIGLGTGFYNTSASYQGSGGDAGINSIPFYAYGAYTPGAFYAMGYLGYTLNLYSLDRTIAFGGINRVATSSVNGNQLNASLESGYDFKVAQVTLTPALSLYYSQAWVDSFTENGAGALDLKVDSQSADSLQTGIGMRLSRPFQTGQILVLPQIYAFYQHEFANGSRGLNARLAQAGNTFNFQTDSPSRDFAVLGAGMAVGLRKNLTLQANYNAEVGRNGYTPMVVSAGLRYEF